MYAVKRAVDKDKSRRIILSGSANMLFDEESIRESGRKGSIFLILCPFLSGRTWKENTADGLKVF